MRAALARDEGRARQDSAPRARSATAEPADALPPDAGSLVATTLRPEGALGRVNMRGFNAFCGRAVAGSDRFVHLDGVDR